MSMPESAGALSFSSAAMRAATFGPTPGARAIIALSCSAMAEARSDGFQRAEHGERDLRADALHGQQQAEPLALDLRHEADQPDLVLADLRLDEEHRRLAARRQRLQRLRRAMHEIADAVHVEDDPVGPKESTTPVSLPIMDACPAR